METSPNIEALSRKFAKLTGILPNDGIFDDLSDLPDFSDAREVIQVMRKREDWPEFLKIIGWHSCNKILRSTRVDVLDREITIVGIEVIEIRYILTPGLMLKEAVERLEKIKEAYDVLSRM